MRANHTQKFGIPRAFEAWGKRLGAKTRLRIQLLQLAKKLSQSSPLSDTAKQFERAILQLQQGNNAPPLLESGKGAICPEMLMKIYEASRDAIILLDKEGRIKHWNPAAENMFGYTGEEVFGQVLHEFLATEKDLAQYREGIGLFSETGKGKVIGKTLALEARHKDGHKVPVELSVSAVEINGGWHAVGIVRDITQRQQAEKDLRAAERSRVLMEMRHRELEASTSAINGLTHALSQKFVALLGYVDFIKMEPDNLRYLNKLDAIIEDIQKYFDFFNLFRFGIVDYGMVNVAELASATFKHVYDTGPVNGSQAHLIVAKTLKGREIKTSAAAFSLILEHPLRNAFDAIKEGGEVVLSLNEGSKNGIEGIELRTIDNGKGIAPDVGEKIFRPFYSTDPDGMARKRGLSLALVQRAVLLLGGEIAVESEPGKGTSFSVWLPLDPPKREDIRG
jgi:PAS domain S-box-containing protein